MTLTDLVLRPAVVADLAAVAEVHLEARSAAGGTMPPPVHDADDVRAHFGSMDLSAPGRELWVAERDGVVVGYAKVTDDWLDDLYVRPGHQRAGVASALFDLVTVSRPDGFCLWVFESNEPARAFYAARGCLELERTDGAANEEHAPDIRVVWPGSDALGCLRGLIDQTDDLLAEALLRRTALTRAVQHVKPSDRRDPEREAQIVERISAVVPELGEERVQRIVDAIISSSLEAVRA